MTAEPWPPATLPDDSALLAGWLMQRPERALAPRLPVQWVPDLTAGGARSMRERYGIELYSRWRWSVLGFERWTVLGVIEEMTGWPFEVDVPLSTVPDAPSPGDPSGAPPDTCRAADGTCDGSCEGLVGEWYPSGRGPWSWVCRCPVSEGYECLRPESCERCVYCGAYRPPLLDQPGERGRRR